MNKWSHIQEGMLYWCDTARSNLNQHFSEKERRPVLVVEKMNDYAALYPCSSFRGDLGACEWVGDVFGSGDTFVIFGRGLFLAPLSDLDVPGFAWAEWETWRSVHREVILADLDHFHQRHSKKISVPLANPAHRPEKPLATSLEALLAPAKRRLEEAERIAALNKPKTPPPAPPPKPKPRISPQEEFKRAIDAIMPYEVLKEDEE